MNVNIIIVLWFVNFFALKPRTKWKITRQNPPTTRFLPIPLTPKLPSRKHLNIKLKFAKIIHKLVAVLIKRNASLLMATTNWRPHLLSVKGVIELGSVFHFGKLELAVMGFDASFFIIRWVLTNSRGSSWKIAFIWWMSWLAQETVGYWHCWVNNSNEHARMIIYFLICKIFK